MKKRRKNLRKTLNSLNLKITVCRAVGITPGKTEDIYKADDWLGMLRESKLSYECNGPEGDQTIMSKVIKELGRQGMIRVAQLSPVDIKS